MPADVANALPDPPGITLTGILTASLQSGRMNRPFSSSQNRPSPLIADIVNEPPALNAQPTAVLQEYRPLRLACLGHKRLKNPAVR